MKFYVNKIRPLNFDDFAPRKSKLTHLTYIENYLVYLI